MFQPIIINKIFIWATVDDIEDPYHEVSWPYYYDVGHMHFISGVGNRCIVVPAIIFRNIKNEEFFFGRFDTYYSIGFLTVNNTVCCRFIICQMISDFY